MEKETDAKMKAKKKEVVLRQSRCGPQSLKQFLSGALQKLQSVSSAALSCPTLRDPMNRSTPGHPVHHQLPESTQTRVHRVGDAIQPSHPGSSPSPPAPNPSQHQSPFQ